MDNNQKIQRLVWLIDDWRSEKDELHEMCSRWEDYDDPGSDPGLQYEQEMKVDNAYDKIVDFCKENIVPKE